MLDHRGVHNFSPGVLDSYFKFNDLVAKGKIEELENKAGFYIDRGSRKMTMIYSSNININQVQEYQRKGPVYSIDKLDALEGPSSFEEIVYDVDVVFNKDSYSSAKKRHQRIVYPFNWVKSQGLTIERLDSSNHLQALELHDLWVEKKIADPKTFKIMFPNARYNRCVDLCVTYKPPVKKLGLGLVEDFSVFPNYIGYVVKRNDSVIAVRVVDCQAPYCFDLAFFGNTWSEPSQLMNYIDIVTLSILRDDHKVLIFNCGAAMSTSLKKFKAHIPSRSLISWRYKKI